MKGWKFNFVAAFCFEVAGILNYFVSSSEGKSTGMAFMFIILGFSQLLLGLASIQKEKKGNTCGE